MRERKGTGQSADQMKALLHMFQNLVVRMLSMGGSTVFLKELHQAGQTFSAEETLI